MSLIQIIILVFTAFVIVKLAKRLHGRELTVPIFSLWLVFWLGVALITWKTSILDRLAAFVGGGRGADLVIYIALLLLFYMLFRIFVKLDQLERRISEIVRHSALRNFEDKKP